MKGNKIIIPKKPVIKMYQIRDKYLKRFMWSEVFLLAHTIFHGNLYQIVYKHLQYKHPIPYNISVALEICAFALLLCTYTVYHFSVRSFYYCVKDTLENSQYKEHQKLAPSSYYIYLFISGIVLCLNLIDCIGLYLNSHIALNYMTLIDGIIILFKNSYGYLFFYLK